MALRVLSLVATLVVAVLAASPAHGESTESTKSAACLNKPYSYAGLQSQDRAHGVTATISSIAAPTVSDGHVGGWIGVGGPASGPGGVPQWLQVGFASFSEDRLPRMYYEVTVAGKDPKYVQLAADVQAGDAHRLSVLEIPGKKSWWRVWADGRAVSPAIHLPGSHGKWYPQAVAENWNGNTGTCNGFKFRFSDLKIKVGQKAGKWQPMKSGYVFQDAGYKVLRTSGSSAGFVATSL